MSIIVSNLSAETKEETLLEFFNFCGRILEINVMHKEDESIGYITFETLNSANLSLILTKSQIDNRVVEIVLNPDQSRFEQLLALGAGEEEPQGEPLVTPPERNQAVNMIASLIASGHKLSDETAKMAKSFDEKYGFSSKIQSGFRSTVEGAEHLAEKLGITEKLNSLQLKEKLNTASQSTQDFFSSMYSLAVEKVNNIKDEVRNEVNGFTADVMQKKQNLYPGRAVVDAVVAGSNNEGEN